MKYKNVRESEKLSEILGIVFDDTVEVNKIAEKLSQSKSAASRKLKALKAENLVIKKGYGYEADKDQIFEEFWEYILDEVRLGDEKKQEQFNQIKNEIRDSEQIREHLLGVARSELDLSNTPLNKIFIKYRDRLSIRYDLVYQLTHNELDDRYVSDEKKEFWRYLQIIQAYLPHAAWTEPIHGTVLQSQIHPGEEHKIEDVDDMWHQLVQTANQNLENMSKEV